MNSNEAFAFAMALAVRGKMRTRAKVRNMVQTPKPPKLPGELRNHPCQCGSGLKGKNCNCANFTR